ALQKSHQSTLHKRLALNRFNLRIDRVGIALLIAFILITLSYKGRFEIDSQCQSVEICTGRFLKLKGEVVVHHTSNTKETASSEVMLKLGDRIETNSESSAIIEFPDGGRYEITPNQIVTIAAMNEHIHRYKVIQK